MRWVGGANTYRFCASPFLKEFCMARLHLYLNPARFLFSKKEAPPLAFAAHSFFQIPPPQKIRMERSGKARGRDARYSARGGI